MTLSPNVDRPPMDSPAPAPPPAWWRADKEKFEALADARLRIFLRENAAAKKAESIVAASLIAAISIYSVDATGAVSIPAASGFLTLFAALVLPLVIAWLLDRRLMQQLGDIRLRSELWLDLVEAVKFGCIDVAQLAVAPNHETEIELLLRKEASIAARFLASRNTLVPHLPLFGDCFTLEND